MRTMVVGTESTVDEVLRTAYPGRMSAAVKKKALTALRRANPEVDFDALEPGTVIRIPDVPGRKQPSRRGLLDEDVSEAVEAAQAFVAAGVDDLAAAAAGEEKAAAKERAKLLRALDADEVQAAMESDQRLAGDVAVIREYVEEQEAGAKARLASVSRVTSRWAEELDVLKQILPEG